MGANTFTPTWYSSVGQPLTSNPWTVYTVEVLGETCCTGTVGQAVVPHVRPHVQGILVRRHLKVAVPPKQMTWLVGISSNNGNGSSNKMDWL